MKFGSQSEVGKIKSVLLKHLDTSYKTQENIDSQFAALNYAEAPELYQARAEYNGFVEKLESSGCVIHYLPESKNTGLDSIYTHDPVIISGKGAILCNMGKAARSGEPKEVGKFLESIGVPVIGEISGKGRLEGGDVVWLNEKTVVVGCGYRSNAEGIRQFTEILGGSVNKVITVDLPHWTGSDDCLHMMSNISPVDHDKAVVYSRLLTVTFRKLLINMGYKLIEVPDEEYESMACNVLAAEPGKCLMLSGNPITKQRLKDAGCEVIEYSGEEISLKGAGGPTCLTRPILRG